MVKIVKKKRDLLEKGAFPAPAIPPVTPLVTPTPDRAALPPVSAIVDRPPVKPEVPREPVEKVYGSQYGAEVQKWAGKDVPINFLPREIASKVARLRAEESFMRIEPESEERLMREKAAKELKYSEIQKEVAQEAQAAAVTPEMIAATKGLGVLTPEERTAKYGEEVPITTREDIQAGREAQAEQYATLAGGATLATGLYPAIAAAGPTAGGSLIALAAATVSANVGGFFAGYMNTKSLLKSEEMQGTKVDYKNAITSRTNMKAAIVYAKTEDPIEARTLYDKEWDKIYSAEGRLKSRGEREWLSQSLDEQTAVRNLIDAKPMYDAMFTNAVNKNPEANYDFSFEEPALTEEEQAGGLG